MKFNLEITIKKPRAEVWKIFDNVENMKKWQPSMVRFESISGNPGQPGAVSKLTYAEGKNKKEFSLIEKITHRDEPAQFDGIYENDFADNVVRNTFIATGENETTWKLETEFKFKTLIMKVMGPLMKKNFMIRTERDMQRFKKLAEGS